MQNGKGKLSEEGDSPHARLKSNYAQERVKVRGSPSSSWLVC